VQFIGGAEPQVKRIRRPALRDPRRRGIERGVNLFGSRLAFNRQSRNGTGDSEQMQPLTSQFIRRPSI
jgi:hypothetical protein